MDLNSFDVVSLDKAEMSNTDGGEIVAAACFIAIMIIYLADL